MNLWQFLWNVIQCFGQRRDTLFNYLWHNKVEVLGYVQVAVALTATAGVIPLSHLPGWLLANGILSAWISRANPKASVVDITLPTKT